MNFSFEGNYKSKRNINLGGKQSHQDKKALLAKAQAERKARERERRRNDSALRIQAFYRGRRESGRFHVQEANRLAEQVAQARHDVTILKNCLRQSIILTDEHQDPWTFIDLARVLADALPQFMDDAGSWLVALFVGKVLIPALSHADRLSPEQLDSLSFALASFLNPSHYTERASYLRVLTFAVTRAHLLTTLVPHLLQPHSPELEHIFIDLARCEPPYTYPVSAYLAAYRPTAPLHSELSRQLLVERITADVLTVPFILDTMEHTTIEALAASLPLGAVLESIVQAYHGDTACFAPEAVAGLLMNTTQLANADSEKHFEQSLDAYAAAMPLLLTHLSNNYLIDPVKKAQRKAQDDSDYSDSEDEEEEGSVPDVVMAEASSLLPPPDPKIARRLESLYDATKISSIVRRFMHRATDGMQTEVVVASLAHLLNSLMLRWPSKKDDLLNHLLYHRWWTGPSTEPPIQLSQLLWETWLTSPSASVFDKDDKLMGSLDTALRTVTESDGASWSVLYLLCEMYTRLLLTIGDDEFYDSSAQHRRLSQQQVVQLSRHLKNLAFLLFWKTAAVSMDLTLGSSGITLGQLRHAVTRLLQQIHSRDSRKSFCPRDHWLIHNLDTAGFSSDVVAEEYSLEESDQVKRISKTRLALISPRLGLLNNIPFVIPFEQRVGIFRSFVNNDRQRDNIDAFSIRPVTSVTIRRNHVFEDGFDHLYGLGAQLKKRIQIEFVDEFGLQEAGIDGGGVFKEFLTSLSREAFDTNYGLFLATPDQLMYPNPGEFATRPDQLAYFEFMGLIVGKALYEGILMDVAFAEFFLKKCLGGFNYLDDLPSLDPDLYNGLIKVKNFDGNVEDLCLDFTVTHDDYGHTRTVELIPGGSHIAVTNENRIRYVYHVANYRLNVQIAKQCRAFYHGLSTIVDTKWLRMFNEHELQVLLGGAFVPIDLADLKQHTLYAGYSEQDPTIQFLWRALEGFTNEERMKFIKFVTSCSRPPLLGFKELQPQLCIRKGENSNDRLPTSSTCVNLLKLPQFTTFDILRQKLLYAINAEAGFDLS